MEIVNGGAALGYQPDAAAVRDIDYDGLAVKLYMTTLLGPPPLTDGLALHGDVLR